MGDGRVELEDVVVDREQGFFHCRLAGHGGVAEHAHLGLGIILVAQQEGVVNDALEVGVQCGLAVAAEGDDVEAAAGFLHLAELLFQGPFHCGAAGHAVAALALGVPAGLAIHAVERASLAVVGHEVDAQGDAQPAAVDGPIYSAVE